MGTTFRFSLGNKKLIRSCKPLLERLYKGHKKAYIELFFHEKDVMPGGIDLTPLLRTRILRRVGNKVRANVQVFPLSGRFICTDFIFSLHRIRNGRFLRNKDDVWAIFAYESPYIAKKAIVEKGDIVLDLATGSGIIAIFCAGKARKVIATDISPKAINYARFNAILNGVEDRVEFRVGDMFDPVKGMKFDLIIWNGPTIPVPNAPEKYPTYCFGGRDGLRFTRKFIEQAPMHLKKTGRMQWLDPSVGSLNEPESMRIVKRKWKSRRLEIVYEQRVRPSDIFKVISYLDKRMIDEPLRSLPKRPLWIKPLTEREYDDWLDFLRNTGYTHIHAGMYMVYPDKKFSVTRTKPKKIVFKRMNHLPQEWHFLGRGRILQLLRICESY